jgi:hypothetical protein
MKSFFAYEPTLFFNKFGKILPRRTKGFDAIFVEN